MKLHRLRITAFGPFADTQELHLDDLSACGLHLIHGPTGSGKTSILDALCYALYGTVPGVRGNRSLVSEHAPAGTQPEVEVEFTVAGRRLRVLRTLDHQAPKKRGTGTTPRRGRVQVDEADGDRWRTIASRADEAGQLIGDALGMGADQFQQVVLLPQGEFAAFLRAKPDERAAVLGQLFDIQRFRDVEAWLSSHRRELATQLTVADSAIAAEVARVGDVVAELELVPPADVTITPDATCPVTELPASIAALQAQVSDAVTAAMADSDAADGMRATATAALQSAQTAVQARLDAAAAAAVVESYDAARDAHTAAVRRADRAEIAAQVMTLVTENERREADLESAATDLRDVAGELAIHLDTAASALLDVDDATSEVLDTLQARLGIGSDVLAQLTAAQPRVDHARERMTQTAAAVQTANDSHTALVARHDATASQRQEAQAKLNDSAADAADLAPAQQLLHQIESSIATAQLVIDACRDTDAASRAEVAAKQDFHDCERLVIDLRRRRLAGIAAELAVDLDEGSACPVCGSESHPDLAQPADGAVTSERVADADAAAAVALGRLQDAAEIRSAASARRDAYQERLRQEYAELLGASPEPDPAVTTSGALGDITGDLATLDATSDLADQLEILRTQRERCQERVSTAARADRIAQASRQAVQQAQAELQQIDELLTAAMVRLTAAQTEATAARDGFAAEAAAAQLLAERHAAECCCRTADPGCDTEPVAACSAQRHHERAIALLMQLRRALGHEDTAKRELAAASTATAAALREHDFGSAGDARAAALSPAQIAAIREDLTRQQQAYAKAQGVLELPAVQTALAEPEPNLMAARQTLADADRQVRTATTHLAACQRALGFLQRSHSTVTALVDESAQLRSEFDTVAAVADAVNGGGDNVMRMRLTSYVLAARLETVTALANERLQVMTEGRYLLQHHDGLAAHGVKSGLGLQVIDNWTGTTRGTDTLSGGECFIASLSLALGLGDAVLAESGGRQLETLLVDEGFGSLDEQTLEHVLEVLDELRSGGRAVGVVSHVTELRNRIPAQIEVRKTDRGSQILVHAATSSPAA
ncbi:AAA family ATPase [Rudaeicoccus suwonensis]|uniref:Nuclease SbcCD subunit C n=1 Tax=Rudaeicoccus suwonensis TaxID=657409 RepID=A0A561EB49_9MICO|nr:SMC family ATPase [Rudaeicoccus suwonensis]TWE12843.1 exonuclease SbcC [Rudaeicoccus suwonensis]